MTLETRTPPVATAPPLQFDLPHDGLRLRVRSTGHGLADMLWLSAICATLVATSGAAIATAGAVGAVASLVFAGSVAGLATCYWLRQYGPGAVVTVDRAGIHDRAAGLPPLGWADIESLDIVTRGDGGQGLYARLTPAVNARRFAGWRRILRASLSQQARDGVLLDGTCASRLPVPLEYLVLHLRLRGAPVREPAVAFDPFEWDARWLPAARAADAIRRRLGRRARPFAAHNLDVARTRGQTAGAAHWEAVIGELRRLDGLPAEQPAEEES